MLATDLINDPAFRTIADRFVDQIPHRIGSLRAAIRERNFAEAQRLAHQLKGAGGSFGFQTITDAATRAETRCMEGEATDALTDTVDRLEAVCQQVVAEWRQRAIGSQQGQDAER